MFAQQLQSQNILKFEVISTSNPISSSDLKYITRNILCWVDLINKNQDYILEETEKQLLSGLLPSDGIDPFVVNFQPYFFSQWFPNRCYIFLLVASHHF